MKKLILFLLLLQPILGIGQKIKYNLFEKDPCTGKIEHSLLYSLSDGKNRFDIEDSLGTVNLPDTGTYTLRFFPDLYSTPTDSLILTITEHENYSDTLTIRKITECMGGLHSGFFGFCCCNMERCDGFVTDYYPNGQKRIEGNFKNGYAVSKLTYYYPTGREREIRFYDRRGKGKIKKKLFFDENGKELK